MRQVISSPKLPPAVGPYSHAVKHNGVVYLSGQVAVNPETGKIEKASVSRQTELILENMKALLEAAGSSLEQVLKVTVFLSSMEHFEEMNRVYARYFTQAPPARLTVAAGGIYAGLDVEIDAIAAAD